VSEIRLLERKEHSLDEVLKALDDLREQVVAREVVCFVAVGIYQDSSTKMWIGNTGRRALEILGAIENLKLGFWNGL